MPSTGLRGRLSVVAVTALAGGAVAACGDQDGARVEPSTSAGGAEAAVGTPPGSVDDDRKGSAGAAGIEPPVCPAGLTGCETAGGTILFVERVDPDGDGDAHFVLAGGDGITAPGISTIDVPPELRPDPLPGPGDLLAAAGPVFEGSFGQRQIQAEAIEFERLP